MKMKIMRFMFPLLIILGLLLAVINATAQDYYIIGEGPICDIELDNNPNQLIVGSAAVIYVISSLDGAIVDTYNSDIAADDILTGSPENDIIYEIGSHQGCSINRDTQEIEYYYLPDHFHPSFIILQDSENLYITCMDQTIGKLGPYDKIVVYDKTDLSQEATWPCVPFPKYGIYDSENNLIIIAEGMAHSHNPAGGRYFPAQAGIQWQSKIGWYDPSREGNLVSQVTLEGTITGLAMMSDGTVIAGLAWRTANEEGAWASTLAIITDPIEYIDIDTYHVVAMDRDSANDRLICSLYDYQSETGGHILVWDYDTREYSIVEAGVSQLIIIKYLDGKLYASNSKDNKVYVIDID